MAKYAKNIKKKGGSLTAPERASYLHNTLVSVPPSDRNKGRGMQADWGGSAALNLLV